MKFKDLALSPKILSSLEKIGYETPTPIQKQAIPIVLEKHDLLAIAQTGTGKTAAFCLPLLSYFEKEQVKSTTKAPRALILTPTRELALQIHENLEQYSENLKQKHAVIFGGVSQGKQVNALKKGPHILVATPGRLLDLINQKHIYLDKIETFILDEADRMLDMGFMRDIQKVIKMLPQKRHNLFFSATMPSEIESLAKTILSNPKKVEVTPESTTVERIAQSAMYVDKSKKADLLVHILKEQKEIQKDIKVLVFVEMKHVANRISENLVKNDISSAAIHGNKSQGARQRALKDFIDGEVKVLVATDIASRGIDVDGVTHVINYELSNVLESYVHRIGRTARAGKEGVAISLVTADEKSYLAAIEKSTGQKITIEKDQPFHSEDAEKAVVMSVGKAKAKMEAERKERSREHRRNSSKKKQTSKRNESGGSNSKKSKTKKKFSSNNKKRTKSPASSSSSSSSTTTSSSDPRRPIRRGYK